MEPENPNWPKRIVGGVTVLAAVVVGGLLLGSAFGQSRPRHATATPAAARSKAMPIRASPLLQTVDSVNQSGYAHGYLPPSSCHAMSASEVMCTHPHYGADAVTFQTLPTQAALYAAYVNRVKQLAGGRFRANFGECDPGHENGERSWNHAFHHPLGYPLSLFVSGQIKDEQAVGRLYCTLIGGIFYIVWTQDDGLLLNEVAGSPHIDTYDDWLRWHHEIETPGTPALMSNMEMSK